MPPVRSTRRSTGAAVLVALALCTGLTACGDDDGDSPPAAGASSASALLAQIPTLGESYPAGLTRFADTDDGKDYGLAVTVAEDGNAVAYLCDGATLGRAFAGTIEDGADSAALKAVKGEGSVELKLSDGNPTAATVKAGDVTDDFTLEATDVGGYFREQVKGVTRGWVVSDTLELKGVQTDESGGRTATTTSGFQSPPLSSSDQQLVGVTENPTAPPESTGFLKARRCARLKAQYNTAFSAYDAGGGESAENAVNLALAQGRSLGCGWSTTPGTNFITT